MSYQLEICANSIQSAIAAQNGGANRIELCDNLAEGGTTPSYGTIKWCVDNLSLEVWPIIRPRGGNFVYSTAEFDAIIQDILICKTTNCHGIVIGILNMDGSVDETRCKEIISLAAPLPVVFHRAFDISKNLSESLEKIIELGFVRVLTSGGKQNAEDGAEIISTLIEQAAGRIEIMPGAGINSNNIKYIAETTKAKAFHTTAKQEVVVRSQNYINNSKLVENEKRFETNLHEVKLLKAIINRL